VSPDTLGGATAPKESSKMSGLTDAEVDKQIMHMVAFIEKEGAEKAEEIDTKAEEEFNIEKVRLVQTEKKVIMKLSERQAKQAEVNKKIATSSQLNAARIKVLQTQDSKLKDVFEKTTARLATIATGGDYPKLVQDLLVQALVSLCETKVEVRCRKCDTEIVKGCLGGAQSQFTEMTGKKVSLTVNTNNYLPDSVCARCYWKQLCTRCDRCTACSSSLCLPRLHGTVRWRRRDPRRRLVPDV